MRRRAALLTVALWSATIGTARAQGLVRRPRVGLLVTGTLASDAVQIGALRAGLQQRGYVEPDTLELLVRSANGSIDRFPVLVQELVVARVDVIVTSSTSATRAAAAETRTIPIVSASSSDLLGGGVVANLARPGGNVTGLSQARLDTAGKEVELAAELLPGLTRITVLRGPAGGAGARVFDVMRAAASARGIEAVSSEAASPNDLDVVFNVIGAARNQAVIVVDGPFTNAHREQIAKLGIVHRVPVFSSTREYVDAGTLASYGPSVAAMHHRAAHFVDRIVRGAAPADLPVEQPTYFELVINRKSAGLLGLSLPPVVLARANEVIE